MTEAATPMVSVHCCVTCLVLTATVLGATFLAGHSIARGGINALTPFCAHHGRLEDYLDRSGFTADDKITFASGASFQGYRYLGDVLWVARWPDGTSCLISFSTTAPSPSFPK